MLSVRIGPTLLARCCLVGRGRKNGGSLTNLADKRTVRGRTIRYATFQCRVYISNMHREPVSVRHRERSSLPQFESDVTHMSGMRTLRTQRGKSPAQLSELSNPRNDKGHPKVAFVGEASAKREAYLTAQPVSSARALPMSASERTVLTPASCRAANFSSAVPLPPEMIAPAWPMRLPGGAVTPAM